MDKIKRYKSELKKVIKKSSDFHHTKMIEAADRMYIYEYIKSCLPFVPANPEILEFDGGVIYAHDIMNEKGGNVEFATKAGRIEWNNPVSYEFDLEQEIIHKKYDVIVATQVLGSFIDPCMVTKRLKEMLKDKGVLIITVSGPAYPRVRGLISFYSKEGLVKIGQSVFGAKNVINARSYGNMMSSICMMSYLTNELFLNEEVPEDLQHEVISGIICVNENK